MKRLALIFALLATAVVLIAVGTGATGKQSGSYRFTAIFDNVSALVAGQEVKVAGVKVGTVDKLSLTPGRKHAQIEMTITRPGIGPFRTDAQCTIRPQSLIGEKFVECQPGTVGNPVLAGKEGQLPVLTLDHTHSLIDIDLVNNISRLPYRERFRLIINEFGTAFAGNGDALNEAIRRSNPALAQTDQVLQILAQQNLTLKRLIADSDAVFAPWAAKRQQVANFIDQAAKVQTAVAARSGDLEQSFRRLPPLLRQLRPTLAQLGALSEQATPVVANLRDAAPDVSKTIVGLGPFTRAATPALVSLGKAADAGIPALKAFEPIAIQLGPIAKNSVPVANNLNLLLGDLNKTGTFQQLATMIFNTASSLNAFDSIGHVARARSGAGLACTEYVKTQQDATTKKGSCDGHLDKGGTKSQSKSNSTKSTAGTNAAVLDYLLKR